MTQDSESVVIDAPAEQIYDMVADMPRMGEWSNECARVVWVDGATGPAPGADVVWRYRFEAVDGGTRVTESYEVTRIPAWARIMDVPTNRHGGLMKTMRHTLGRLKSAAEVSECAKNVR